MTNIFFGGGNEIGKYSLPSIYIKKGRKGNGRTIRRIRKCSKTVKTSKLFLIIHYNEFDAFRQPNHLNLLIHLMIMLSKRMTFVVFIIVKTLFFFFYHFSIYSSSFLIIKEFHTFYFSYIFDRFLIPASSDSKHSLGWGELANIVYLQYI